MVDTVLLTKTDWFHVFLFLHMAGLASVLLLPITGYVLRNELKNRDFVVSSKLAMFFTRVDIAAMTGVTLLFLSGLGQMWVKGIAVQDLSGNAKWLGVKIILFACVLVLLSFVSPSIFSIYRITRGLSQSEGGPTAAEIAPSSGGDQVSLPASVLETELKSNYTRLLVAIPAIAVLVLAIIVLATFQPSF